MNLYGLDLNHSTHMAVIDMYIKITQALDENKYAVGIFFDLSKATDTVNHYILLRTLELYGVRRSCLDWFGSYLKNRFQLVSVYGTLST